MSLLRKIRRRHKAFLLKRSAKIHGDGGASIFPVNDGEDADEDDDAGLLVESLHQADDQNGDTQEKFEMPLFMERFSMQTDDFTQSSVSTHADSGIEVGHGMQIVGKESQFWFRIVKTAAFLLITVGAFSVGKLAAVGITLAVALTCKLLVRDGANNHESLPLNTEKERPASEAIFEDESNDIVGMNVSHLVMNANGHRQMALEAHDEEALNCKGSGDTLLTQRRQLRRLNCIKLPLSGSESVEAIEYSPSWSAKASPRTWFRNLGNSSPTGKGIVASAADMNKQGKFRSKVLLRHLRRKGEPRSAPSSPLSFSLEGSNDFCVASDGSDTERSVHPMAPVERRSKFRPTSPAKEASVLNASMGLSDQQTWHTLAASKGKRTPLPATLIANEAMVTNVHTAAIQKHEIETFACLLGGREDSVSEVHIPPSPAIEEMQCASTPATSASRDAAMKVDIHSPFASTHELPHQRREEDQPTRSQEGSIVKAVASINQDSLQVAVHKGGEKRRKQMRVGTLWVTAGFMITIAGLFVGRMMAVTGLVCYWYALSFKKRRASERKR